MSKRPSLPAKIRNRAGVDALLAAATNFEEKLPRDPLKKALDLGRVTALLASVDHPQVGPRTVHIAGSKGKGTVARMIASGLARAGRKPIGLYTSPHLEDLSERIAIDGKPIREKPLARAAHAVLPHVRATQGTSDAPTFFEIFTAIAWCAFREAGCTDVVLETGLGGRLDATNVCVPAVTVITCIELEHTRLLGDTLALVAGEKAGILKPGVPVVAVGLAEEALEVVRARARQIQAPFDEDATADVRTVTLPGAHHLDNARAAFLALRILDVSQRDALNGICETLLPGILEEVVSQPRVIIDGAHTLTSARGTRRAVAERWPGEPVVLLTAMLEEKDVEGIASALAEDVTHVVTTRVGSPRCLPAEALADRIRAVVTAPVQSEPDTGKALRRACDLAGPRGLVLCSGSTYLAGDVRKLAREFS